VFRIIESVRGGLINWDSPGFGSGINLLSGMKLERFEMMRCRHVFKFFSLKINKIERTIKQGAGPFAGVIIKYALRHTTTAANAPVPGAVSSMYIIAGCHLPDKISGQCSLLPNYFLFFCLMIC